MCDVLIVDDDFMVAQAHECGVAQMRGFSVVGVAHSGAHALELIRELGPQLVLLDMYLPDMTGLDVIRRARDGGHNVDFLVLSAARNAEMVTAALQGGIVGYLLKPFKLADLQTRLVGYAERRRVLTRHEELTQSEVDHALGSALGPRTLPTGHSKETAALVERALRERPAGIAASECGEKLGLSRVVARKYLEHFVQAGQASVSHRYGQTGRPQRLYSWLETTPRRAGVET